MTTPEPTPPLTDDEPTPSLAEYRRQAAEDSNVFWRLSSGDHQNLLDEAIEQIDQLTVHNGFLVTEVRFQGERAEQARADYDATEVTVGCDIFKRGELREVLANVTASRDEYAREAKRQAARVEALRAELVEARSITDQVRNELAEARRDLVIAENTIRHTKELLERRTANLKARAERAEARLQEVGRLRYDEVDGARFPHDHTGGDGPECAGCWAGAIEEALGEAPVKPSDVERAEDTTMADPEPNYIDITTVDPSPPWLRKAYINRTPSEVVADLIEEHQRGTMPLAEAERLHGLEVTRPGDKARLNLDEAATALYDWTTQLRQAKRGPWPTGRIEVIQGIEVAARWLRARAKHEREAREQQAADYAAAVGRIAQGIKRFQDAWKDAFAAEPEPTWRDVIRAMWHTGVRFVLRTRDMWDLHTYDGEWIGSVAHPRPSVWRIELVNESTTVQIHDAEPGAVLDQAAALGLIGGTDA